MRLVLALLVALPLLTSAQNQKRNYDTLPNVPDHWVKRYELFKTEPIVPGKVMMVGNSITEGGDWKMLLNDATVINRGISGDVTFGVLNRIQDITDRKPSKLFLLIGVNDLSRSTPEDIIIQNIKKIITKIHEGSPDTKIYVQSILPLNESFKNFMWQYGFGGKKDKVIYINKIVMESAKKLNFTFIDLYNQFLDKDGNLEANFSYDGLHLNAAGYEHWSNFLKKKKYL